MGNRHINAHEGGPRKLHFWDFLGISSSTGVKTTRENHACVKTTRENHACVKTTRENGAPRVVLTHQASF
jgi:hypothetical protein